MGRKSTQGEAPLPVPMIPNRSQRIPSRHHPSIMATHRALFATAIAAVALSSSAQNDPPIWNVKAVMPTGLTLDVKAFGPDGKPHDVKALEIGDAHLLDVKALVGGASWPIKVIASSDAFLPVKAIAPDGTLWDVKALSPEGEKLDVKGVARSGHIIHIKALGPDRQLYGVKAISPEGRIHDIKGVRMGDGEVETTVNGVPVAAHVKALPQALAMDEDFIWNIKAIDHDGHILGVKAIDKDGGMHDVKAFMENGDRWILDVKALVQGRKVPVKMLVSTDPLIPVKGLGADGTVYDIKAIAPDGRKLDVKGVKQEGNVIHLKALDGDQQLGVKALSPHGVRYDVKGLKFTGEEKETTVGGVAVRAHVKALPPAE